MHPKMRERLLAVLGNVEGFLFLAFTAALSAMHLRGELGTVMTTDNLSRVWLIVLGFGTLNGIIYGLRRSRD